MIKDALCQYASFLAILTLFFLFLASPTFGASVSNDEATLDQRTETKNHSSEAFDISEYSYQYNEQTARESLGIILASDSSSYENYDYRAKQISTGKLLKTSVIAQLATTLSWVLFIASAPDGSSGSFFWGLSLAISSITAMVTSLIGMWKLGDLLTSEKYFLQHTKVKPTSHPLPRLSLS